MPTAQPRFQLFAQGEMKRSGCRRKRRNRIGQRHPDMRIINLHLEGTVETDAYKALKGRIRMFEQVVGTLQPILAEAASVAIGRAVMVGRAQRDKAWESAVAAAQQAPEIRSLDLDDGLQIWRPSSRRSANCSHPPWAWRIWMSAPSCCRPAAAPAGSAGTPPGPNPA